MVATAIYSIIIKLLLLFYPGTGNEKNTLCNTKKYKKNNEP